MKQIPLTQGKFALVDNEDYDWLMQWKWHTIKSPYTYYAARNTPRAKNNGKQKRILMHRAILNIPRNMQVDHGNHNGLDNRKENIRQCTHADNMHNQRPQTNCTSRYKGVYLSGDRWRVKIKYNREIYNLGEYSSETDAAKAYDMKAIELFGDFAYLNFREIYNA